MSWVIGGYTMLGGEEPRYTSTMPEAQEDNHVEVTPVGASGTDATIVQYVNTPSIQAVLTGRCGDTTKTALLGKRKTTVTITTPFDGTGKSWYLKSIAFVRWTSQEPWAVAGASESYIYTIKMVGR